QRAVATVDDPPCGGVELLGRSLYGVPPVRVRLDPVAHGAAEEPVDRLVERLACDVPAGRLDAGDARHRDLPGARVVVAHHPADEIFDLERVGSEHMVGRGLGEIPEQRVGVVDHPHLADAFDALVRADDHEGEVAPGSAEHERTDLDDLHCASTVEGTGSRTATPKRGSVTASAPGSSTERSQSAWLSSTDRRTPSPRRSGTCSTPS